MLKSLAEELNALSVLAIAVILIMASVLEFAYGEPPCPLCLLQRAGFMFMSIGFLLNLRFGPRPGFYGLSIIAGLFTAAVGLRQTLLHIDPGTGSYGDPIFGLHLYTWTFIVGLLFVLWIAVLLMIGEQFKKSRKRKSKYFKKIVYAVFTVMLLIVAFNIFTSFSECGIQQCPDNPTGYKYFLKKG